MNRVAADVRRLILFPAKEVRASYFENELKETLALTPALSPRRGRSIHSAREFSCSVARHRLIETYVES